MKQIDLLLEEYGESHQHPLNKLIHWIAVPAIVWTVVALLWSIPFPLVLNLAGISLNWAILILLAAQIYWFRLSVSLGLGLFLYNVFMIQLTVLMPAISNQPLWKLALFIFVIAWILQFIGHAIEGKRPSFLKDLQFLLIGPAWLMAFLYRTLGLRY